MNMHGMSSARSSASVTLSDRRSVSGINACRLWLCCYRVRDPEVYARLGEGISFLPCFTAALCTINLLNHFLREASERSVSVLL